MLFTGESRFSLQCDIRRVLVWRKSSTRKKLISSQYSQDRLMEWSWIIIDWTYGHAYYPWMAFWRPKCLRRDIPISCRCNIFRFFLLMNDNAELIRFLKNMFKPETILRIEGPDNLPYFNSYVFKQIEHVWYILERYIITNSICLL